MCEIALFLLGAVFVRSLSKDGRQTDVRRVRPAESKVEPEPAARRTKRNPGKAR